ncbi:MAG: hypothetical protein KDE27_13035, partial [Planctomycetes bacterium]|nr:hypothetical protein [Planctomycetota bacterium]
MSRRRLALGLGVALAAGCSDPAIVDGQREIAGELRALRSALRAANAQPVEATVRPAAPSLDRAALTDALAPLREVMVGLAGELDAMQTRQTALTEELGRWSQLLAQTIASGTATGPAAAEAEAQGQALVQRVQQLEQAMAAQDGRHRQVEELMIRALDQTSDRLEQFLRQVGEIGGAGNGALPVEATSNRGGEGGASPDDSTPGKPAVGGDGKPPGGGDEDRGEGDGEAEAAMAAGSRRLAGIRRSGEPALWWFGVAAVALLLSGVFALWLGRENRAGTAWPEPREVDDAESGDDGVRELWAAAALLGEAVGRLRDNGGDGGTAAATDGPEEPALAAEVDVTGESAAAAGPAPAPVADGGLFDDDYFVLDDDLLTSDLVTGDLFEGAAGSAVVGEPDVVLPGPRRRPPELRLELPA